MAAAALWTPPAVSQDPETDALWNALVSHVGQPLPLRGRANAVVALGAAPSPETLVLRVRFANGPAVLVVPVAFPFGAMFGADLALDDLALLPLALRDALSEGVVSVVAAGLPDHSLGAVNVERGAPWGELALRPEERARLRWFRATVQGLAPEPIVLDVAATLGDLADIFGGGVGARRVWSGLKAQLTREVAFTLGRLTLSVAALRSLTPGTVIVLEAGLDAAVAQLRTDDALFRFRASGTTWTCAAVTPMDADRHPAGISMSPDQTRVPAPSATGGEKLDLPYLEVPIDLDLGRVTVPLSEIETWQPGSVVPLQPAVPREGVEVTLRSNGRVIGTGDLVRVDDRLAVRISSLTFGP